MTKYLVAGGAGFIGSHLTTELLGDPDTQVVVYDNFSSGREWHLEPHRGNPKLSIISGDIKNEKLLKSALAGVDIVYHFASNPDISAAMTRPDLDFWEGTFLTEQILEAMRQTGVRTLLYASGSGVYGETGTLAVTEDYSPMVPISTYGASKLAGESLICSYCHMFDFRAAAFRFANVIGPHQTHGVIFDFIRKLLENPRELAILGNGRQSKSYIHVHDVLAGMRLIEKNLRTGYDVFNVATEDYITVEEIADAIIQAMNLKGVRKVFAGGDRGWKGDVPIVRFNCDRIHRKGWKNSYTARQALEKTIDSILKDAHSGRFGWNVAAKGGQGEQ